MVSRSTHASRPENWPLHAYPSSRNLFFSSLRCHDRYSHQLCRHPLGHCHQGRVLDRGEARSHCTMDRSDCYKCPLVICAIRTCCKSPQPSQISFSNIKETGSQQTLQRTPLPRRPLRFPSRPRRPHHHLPSTPPLPNQQTKVPPLEHHNLLLLPLKLLRQHFLRVPLPIPRLIRSNVLGISIPV